MGRLNFFTIKDNVPVSQAWFMGFAGVLSIVAMNFNLKMNSIGFYQLSKLCTIPVMVIYKYFFLGQSTPYSILCSLVVLLAGLCLFTVNDVQFNVIGTIIALVAVVSTVLYQTQTQSFQKQYSMSGTQLSHNVGIPQFAICFLAAIFMETSGVDHNIFEQKYKTATVIMIISTGLLAVAGNIIGFSLIGKAGPLTFQVVGHVKTMLIFIVGLILFKPEQSETKDQKIKKIMGLLVSMCGVIMYTMFEMKSKNDEQKESLLHKDEPNPELLDDHESFEDLEVNEKDEMLEEKEDEEE